LFGGKSCLYKNMKPKLIIFIFLTTLGLMGCKRPLFLDDVPPGPPVYKQGWADGCETALDVIAGTRLWNKFKQDPKLVKNPMYYKVWHDSFWYCYFWTREYKKETI